MIDAEVLLASHVTVDATSEHLYDYALQFSALLGSTSISGTFSHAHLCCRVWRLIDNPLALFFQSIRKIQESTGTGTH